MTYKTINNGMLDVTALCSWLLDDSGASKVEFLLANGRYDVADATLLALGGVLSKEYNFPRSLVAENISMCVNHPQIDCNETLFKRVIPKYTESRLSLLECYVLEMSKLQDQGPLWTFDKQVIKNDKNAKDIKQLKVGDPK